MTYIITTPNQSASPGIFPGMNNTNFQRLRDIINSNHNFVDTDPGMNPNTQGYHNRVSFINIVGLPTLNSADSVLYSQLDGNGVSQLNFLNSAGNVVLTPPSLTTPQKLTGTISLNSGQGMTVFPYPGYNWAGTGWAIIVGTKTFCYTDLVVSGNANGQQYFNNIDGNSSGGLNRPSIVITNAGVPYGDLGIVNNDSSTRTITWSLIFNRLA
jgi:hypothetical protein